MILSVIKLNVNLSSLLFKNKVNSYYGSKYFSRRLGFPYNDQLNDFDGFGTPNRPGAQRMPQSATSAVIFYSSKNNPVFQIGAAGGSKMIGAIFNTFFNFFVNGMGLKKANKAPRCTPTYRGLDEHAVCETNVSEAVKEKLRSLGVSLTISQQGFGGVTTASTIKKQEADYDVRRGGEAFIANNVATPRQAAPMTSRNTHVNRSTNVRTPASSSTRSNSTTSRHGQRTE